MRPDILIVYDAPDQLQLMLLIFKKVATDLVISTANSGEEALRLLRAQPKMRPKVILLDLRMPGKDGKAILSELKLDPDLRRIPVCIFSDGDVERDIRESYDLGASLYFTKPVGLDALAKFGAQFRELYLNQASHCLK